jgi:hypothetical protein
MSGKDDWEKAYREIIARGRDRLGDPPTAEEIEAYSRGALPEAKMAHVRELLAYYPDLASALNENEPPAMTEQRLLTDAQMAAGWESVQRRVGLTMPAPIPFAAAPKPGPSRTLAIAASVAAAILAGLYIHSRWVVRDLRQQLSVARVKVDKIVVSQEGSRGPARPNAIRLAANTESVMVVLTLVDGTDAKAFRLELVDAASIPERVIWSAADLTRRRDGTFAVQIPRNLLEGADFRFRLYSGGEHGRLLATYRLPPIAE